MTLVLCLISISSMPGSGAVTDFSRRLREFRARRGLSQRALCRAAGLSATAVQWLENGKHTNPRLSTLRGLAAALECTVGELAD